jgi:hypothetical protein
VQRATAHSKTGIFRVCGVAEAPPGFQAGWFETAQSKTGIFRDYGES